MTSKDEKKRRQRLVQAIVDKQTKKEIEEMPLLLVELGGLFDYLDKQLGIHNCDHTSKMTIEHLVANKLDPKVIVPWLREYGGYCDCEVLANVEESWQSEINKIS